MPTPPASVLFVVAAGERIGFGHLVRCRSLARALHVPPVVVIRGSTATRQRAARNGWRVVEINGDRQVERLRPCLLVVDDPSLAAVRAWVRRARRLDIPVATVHDLGIAAMASDLVIDASLAPAIRVAGRHGTLHGPTYAILDPAIARIRRSAPTSPPRRVLIALGGGRQLTLAAAIANAIATRLPGVDVRVAGGFTAAARRPRLHGGARWIDVRDGLAREMAASSAVVVAGGVTLYEACALGVPAVAIPLNSPQQVTIRAVATRGAALDAGPVAARGQTARPDKRVAAAARLLCHLFADTKARRQTGRAGKTLVDGRGAFRVASALRRLLRHRPRRLRQ